MFAVVQMHCAQTLLTCTPLFTLLQQHTAILSADLLFCNTVTPVSSHAQAVSVPFYRVTVMTTLMSKECPACTQLIMAQHVLHC